MLSVCNGKDCNVAFPVWFLFNFFVSFSKLQRTSVLKSWDHASQNNFFPQLFRFNFAQDIRPCSRIQWAEFDQGIRLQYAMVPNSQQEGGSTTRHAETCFSFDHDTTGMITTLPRFRSSATPWHSWCVSGHYLKAQPSPFSCIKCCPRQSVSPSARKIS